MFIWMLAVICFLTACSSAKQDSMENISAPMESYDDYDMKESETEAYGMMEESVEVTVEEESAEAQAEEVAPTNRKLIKRQYMTVETMEFDEFTALIKNKTQSEGGYIENSSVSGNSYYSSDRRYASYTIRIPVEKMDAFMNGIQAECNVTEFSEEVDDITLNYVDTQSRIEALKIEQENLMKMLNEEGDLDTILRIQSRLTEVRYELQSYESQMRLFDNDIEYSTIYLDVREVKRETAKDDGSFGTRLMDRLSDSFYDLGIGFENFALFLLGGIPYWILLAVIIGGIVFIVKKIIKRINNKKQSKNDSFSQGKQMANMGPEKVSKGVNTANVNSGNTNSGNINSAPNTSKVSEQVNDKK